MTGHHSLVTDEDERESLQNHLAAWLVHLYTASGGVVGMFALFAAAEGRTREAFLMLMLTLLIDGTDGMLARKVGVRRILPNFDGAMMDNVIDVFTYIMVPVFIMWKENLLPSPVWVVVPIIATCYAYGQVNMKTNDAYFLGFPSYWNFIALYLFWLRPDPTITAILLLVPGILSFIPTRYLYPSKNKFLAKPSWALGILWAFLVLWLLFQDTPPHEWVLVSFFYPVYYMGLSFYVDWRLRRNERRAR